MRGTERAPTRSGVIGLVAAALGLARTAPLDEFDGLGFGVRIDQPGSVERDFQTARTLDGTSSMPLSERYYLADAVFLAGLSSDDHALLVRLHEALRHPHYPLYLGRRAFPPAGPLTTWIENAALRDALRAAPWQVSDAMNEKSTAPPPLEMLVDALPGEPVVQTLADVPRSFDPRRRRHDVRDVTLVHSDVRGVRTTPPHDPMRLVSNEEV